MNYSQLVSTEDGGAVLLKQVRYWFKQNVFIHRNHKFNKQVQETQKQYAYLSVTYRQNDNYTHIYDGKLWSKSQRQQTKPKTKTTTKTDKQNKNIRKNTTNATITKTTATTKREEGAEGEKANK